jgi:hypothetical protein
LSLSVTTTSNFAAVTGPTLTFITPSKRSSDVRVSRSVPGRA